MRRLVAVAVLVLAVPVARADGFRDLVKGDDAARSAAAGAILKDYPSQARTAVRRALVVAAEVPDGKHLPSIVKILKDAALDDLTRQTAAMALGVIGRDHPDLWPPGDGEPNVHRPLAAFARKELMRCMDRSMATPVRRACAEAIGIAKLPEGEAVLRPLIDDPREDPAVRIFAGRAVTRLTGQFSVSRASLESLVQQVTVVVSQP